MIDGPTPPTRTLFWRKGAALAACAVFVLAAILYAAGKGPLYHAMGTVFGFELWRFAFLDTDTVLSAVRCFRAGVDAYLINPCDDLGRVYTYSPLWMLLTALPVTTAWITPVGLVVDAAFLASLFLLPIPRNAASLAVLSLATVSGASAFALERGNNDLVLFALVAAAAWLLARSPRARSLGYALAFLAGLLKYYPMAVMGAALREKSGRFLVVAASAIIATALFGAIVWSDLLKAFANIPVGSVFDDMFGSTTVPTAIDLQLGATGHIRAVLHPIMILAAVGIALGLGLATSTRSAVARLTEAEAAFLLVGGLMIVGCFFTAQNIGYRAVHLILCMPGLLALAVSAPNRRFKIAPGAAVLLLWAMSWRHAAENVGDVIGGQDGARIGYLGGWVVRELLWWSVVTLLLSTIVAILRSAPIARHLFLKLGYSVPGDKSDSRHGGDPA